MEQALATGLAPRRVNLWLVRVFAGIALLLAAAGVYAVTAFSVALRARELAIRAALGAERTENLRLVVLDAIKPIAAGLAGGAGVALASTPLLRAVLFGVAPYDPRPVAVVSVVLFLVGGAAALAAATPIRRIDPIEALKVE
jgi:ABC-type antimicrobial peptide transport system permease subunit